MIIIIFKYKLINTISWKIDKSSEMKKKRRNIIQDICEGRISNEKLSI